MSSVGRSSFLGSRRRASAARTAVALVTALAVVGSGLVIVQGATPPARAAVGAATTSAPAEKPDLVSARLAARLGGHRVEITGERTETAATFANPDGTLSTETAARPVRVRRDTGWVPADPTLVAAPDGVVSPRATAVGLAVSGGGAGDLIRATMGRSILALRWTRQLPAPTLSGATATYANVLPNVDLKVTADVEGFEQLLVVKARPSAPLGTIRIPLSLSDLSASQDAGGNLVFKDSSDAVVAVSPAPRMWGATRDAAGTEPTRSAPVRTALVTVGGAQELDLIPDAAFLADPTVTYPVTVDPAVTVARAHWTYVDKAYPTTNYYNSADIARVGTWNGGTQVDRSIFSFDVSRFRGTHVLSATLNTYENSAYSCTAAPVDLWDAGPTSTSTTWNAQPAVVTKWTTVTTAKGYSSSCPAGAVPFTVTNLVQAWANNGYNPGNFELRAPNETANVQWKKFNNNPTLSVTYNSYPKPPTSPATAPAVPCTTGAGRPFLNTTTPQLKAAVADPDGGTLVGSFSLYVTGNATPINTGSSASVASGAVATRTVPAGVFGNGGTYSWHARGYDGTDYSTTYSPWCEFTVDTTAPAAPVVSSTTYPANGWAGAATGPFSWTDASTDVVSYLYGLDQPSPATATSASSVTLSPAAGWHILYVRAKDRAGNLSAVSSYRFGVGVGGLSSPADQDRSQRRVSLLGTAPDTKTHVSYRYRTDTAAPFADVPAGDVTYPGTSTHPAWPVGRDSSGPNAGFFPPLTWDVAATVGGDGLVQVEACFFTSATDPSPVCSPANNLQLVAHAFGDSYATEAVGPGTVSLLTGDFSVSATDVAVPSYAGTLSLGRSLTTLAPPAASSSATGVFGPGWTASLPGPDAGASDLTLTDRTAAAGYVLLTDAEGGEELYVKTGAGSTYPYAYAGQGDAGRVRVDADQELGELVHPHRRRRDRDGVDRPNGERADRLGRRPCGRAGVGLHQQLHLRPDLRSDHPGARPGAAGRELRDRAGGRLPGARPDLRGHHDRDRCGHRPRHLGRLRRPAGQRVLHRLRPGRRRWRRGDGDCGGGPLPLRLHRPPALGVGPAPGQRHQPPRHGLLLRRRRPAGHPDPAGAGDLDAGLRRRRAAHQRQPAGPVRPDRDHHGRLRRTVHRHGRPGRARPGRDRRLGPDRRAGHRHRGVPANPRPGRCAGRR